ncbi:Hypothetical predicted protein [Mytilus galloprovincialis]|uniref:Fibrinogen C-terminal domain-containing protein n=1 Tax=Mytilus galloprovincialis TaxID=29158 RepID=A0A8B6BNY4_MYTGA|nr:Hypothetical predicted protein [Mytilus galloprovincialis]
MKCGSLLCLLLHLTAAITDKAVNASLLDNQTDPLVAIFDLSKANESDKLNVGEDTNTKMDAIKDHFKDKVGVNINDEIRTIVEEVLLKKGYYNYTDAVKKNTDAILRIQDDQKQMSARFNSRIKIIYTTVEKKVKPRECADVDFLKDGVYVIYPRGENQPKRAYCVWQDNRKWTVIQRRFDFSVDFYRSWNEYKEGFGTASGEHWLGNDFIHSISTNGRHRVKFILGKDGTKKYAEYANFRLKDEKSKYKLKVSGYSGTAGDSIDSVDSQGRANGQKFSTYDRDNDNNKKSNCAIMNEGGWWYNSCDYASLNDMDSYKIINDDEVNVPLLDTQNAPLFATLDLSKANRRIKSHVFAAVKAQIGILEEKLKEYVSDIEKNVSVSRNNELRIVVENVLKEKGYDNLTAVVTEYTDTVLKVAQQFKQLLESTQNQQKQMVDLSIVKNGK